MQKARTHFELVPIAVAKRVAAKEGRAKIPNSVPCVICGNSVPLENCKIDEDGDPVHEQCYVAKLARTPSKARFIPRQ